ncbi:MAG: HlyD family efflux transporter periplasmic adaptor subunit [Planctomycetota bacterium]
MTVTIEPNFVQTCATLVSNLEQQLDETIVDETSWFTEFVATFQRAITPLECVRVTHLQSGNVTWTDSAGTTSLNEPSEVVNCHVTGEHVIRWDLWLDRDCPAHERRCVSETAKSAARLLKQVIARNRVEMASRLEVELQQLNDQYSTLSPHQRAHRCVELIAQATRFDQASVLRRRGVGFELLASSANTKVDRSATKVRRMQETAHRIQDRFADHRELVLRRDDPKDAVDWISGAANSVHAYRLANGEFLVFGESSTATPPAITPLLWLTIEGLLRRLSDRTGASMPSLRIKAILLGLSFVASGLFLLFFPMTVRVAASGYLTPVMQNSIYAPTDGVITEVFFAPGEQVKAGDPLFELASHELALREAEVLGAMMSAREQLAVTIARRGDRETNSAHVDRRVIEVRIEQLEQQLGVLNQRKDQLTVRSPIDGIATVLLEDASASLSRGRPVQAGQAIARVLKPDGGYEIRVEIDDSDTGYVVRANAESETPLNCTYRRRGDPTKTYQATLHRVADSVHLNEFGQRVLPATLTPERTDHVSVAESGVTAWIESESAPAGFVLFRKVVETLRMHGWI